MSRVAYCGNFGPEHSTENHVAQALDSLGHDVGRFQEGEQEAILLNVVKGGALDVVLWTRTASLADEQTMAQVLATCWDRGIPTVAYHLDRWWGLSRVRDIGSSSFFRCAYVCTADGGHDKEWADLGINHHWFPPAVSEFECVPGTPRDEYRSRVAFVGSWQSYGHDEWWPQRKRMLDHVEQWYGSEPGGFAYWPLPGQPAIRGADLRDLYASVDVVVGDSCLAPAADGTPMTRYVSDRMPETIGRGGFLIHPRVEGVTDGGCWTEGEHLACYDLGDMDELRSVIDRYLDHDDERRKTAAAGREHTLREHTYTARMRQLWTLLGV